MDDLGEYACRWLRRVPPEMVEACTPHGVMWRVHGLSPGESTCASCGRVVELYDYDHSNGRCPECGRPWPMRCSRRDCPTLVQPERYQNDVRSGWDEPSSYCSGCENEDARKHREQLLVRGTTSPTMNPWGVPRRPKRFAVQAYKPLPWRADLDTARRAWLSSDMGRDGTEASVLYVWGTGAGAGKTVGAARCVVEAVAMGLVRSLTWIREKRALQLLADRSDEDARNTFLRRLYDTDLLVVDEALKSAGAEYLTRDNILSRAGEALRDVYHLRFEDGRPVIMTSNTWCGATARSPGDASAWEPIFGEPLASRFYAAAQAIRCEGHDLRRL